MFLSRAPVSLRFFNQYRLLLVYKIYCKHSGSHGNICCSVSFPCLTVNRVGNVILCKNLWNLRCLLAGWVGGRKRFAPFSQPTSFSIFIRFFPEKIHTENILPFLIRTKRPPFLNPLPYPTPSPPSPVFWEIPVYHVEKLRPFISPPYLIKYLHIYGKFTGNFHDFSKIP